MSEGWHGVQFDKPLARTREYVEIVRTILAREEPLNYAGEHFTLPLPDGPGKPLKLMLHPGPRPTSRSTWPRSGPKNLELAGEIADGWLAIFFNPEQASRVDGPPPRGQGEGRQDDGRASTSSRPSPS